MKRFIDGLMVVIFILMALISNSNAHDMTITEELLQRQEDATRELQENQRSRAGADELREIQEERASELREYQDEATENLNQVDVRKHRKRERKQEKVFDHRPVFKDDLDKYNRKRKKSF